MKVALVAFSDLPRPGPIECHVFRLARGLARRGLEVEVLVQGRARGAPRVSDVDGVVVRRFPSLVGQARVAVARDLDQHLRRAVRSYEIVDVHSGYPPLARAVARADPRRLVFTPHAPIERLLRWPHGRVTRTIVERAARVVCSSRQQADLLDARVPAASGRVCVVTRGVDLAAIRAARPRTGFGNVVLNVGWLQRRGGVERAIAAMAALDSGFRLVVVGDGPATRRLRSYTRDLDLSATVEFVGPASDADRYRWLRTAVVVTALSELRSSGRQVFEPLAAGTPIVVADSPIHREAAAHVGGAGLAFVSPEASPLKIADAILQSAATRVPRDARLQVPSWDATVDGTVAVYGGLAATQPTTGVGGNGLAFGGNGLASRVRLHGPRAAGASRR